MTHKIKESRKHHYTIELLYYIAEMNQGKIFGELGLLENKPRSATLIAAEDTWWGVLTKGPFERILKKFEKDKMNVLIEDIDHFLNFKMMTRAYKAKLLKGMSTVNFIRNQVIYEEGQSSDYIYFVLEGEYEVSK